MSFFDDVASFFGGGDSREEPITVPLPRSHDDDPGVQAAQARYAEACRREDELKALEPEVRARAEAARDQDQAAQHEAARTALEALKARADHLSRIADDPRAGAQAADRAAELQALHGKIGTAELKLRQTEATMFRMHNPLDKYMEPQFVQEQRAAEQARLQAQLQLDAARRSAAAR